MQNYLTNVKKEAIFSLVDKKKLTEIKAFVVVFFTKG